VFFHVFLQLIAKEFFVQNDNDSFKLQNYDPGNFIFLSSCLASGSA